MNKLLEWYVKLLTFFPRWLRRLIILGVIFANFDVRLD